MTVRKRQRTMVLPWELVDMVFVYALSESPSIKIPKEFKETYEPLADIFKNPKSVYADETHLRTGIRFFGALHINSEFQSIESHIATESQKVIKPYDLVTSPYYKQNEADFLYAVKNKLYVLVKAMVDSNSEDSWLYGHKAIQLTIENKDVRMAKLLLEDRRNDSVKNGDFSTLLAEACEQGDMDLFIHLVFESLGSSYYSFGEAFVKASTFGRFEMVKILLKLPNVNPSFSCNAAIRNASGNGHFKIVELLLKDSSVDPTADSDYSIRMASQNGHLKIVSLLLNDSRVDPSAHNNYAVRSASQNGHANVVQLLLTARSVHPSYSYYGEKPIVLASQNGHSKVVKVLLEDERVDPTVCDNHAIRGASANGHAKVIQLLLKDPRVDPSANDNEAIRMAATNGHFEVVRILLKHEVDPSVEFNFPLRAAFKYCNNEVVKILLNDARVDPSVCHNLPIKAAAFNGNCEIVEFLLKDKRVDPTASDNYAIRNAARFGHDHVVKVLLQDKRVNASLESLKDCYPVKMAMQRLGLANE